MSVPVFQVIRKWLPDGATRIGLLTRTEVSVAALTVAAELGIDVLRDTDADSAIDTGYDLLVIADAGDTVAALSIIALYTRVDASRVMPAMDDDEAWMTLAGAVRDRMRATRDHLTDFERVLTDDHMASIEFMHLAMTAAARRGVPVLFNGIGACAAAVIADRISHPQSVNVLCADAIGHPAVAASLDRINRPALATFDIPDAHLGALLAVPIIRAASLTS